MARAERYARGGQMGAQNSARTSVPGSASNPVQMGGVAARDDYSVQQSLYPLIDEIGNVLAVGKKVPLSNQYMVDKDRIIELLSQLQSELPTSITAAQGVVENQTRIIYQAREKAEHTLSDANTKARQTLNEAQTTAQQTVNEANMQANEIIAKAQSQAQGMLTEAQEQSRQIVSDAEKQAKQLVNEQEIMQRAQMEADDLRQSTQQEVQTIYHDVYQHIDEVLAQLDRSISEKLTDIRMTRQQIESSSAR